MKKELKLSILAILLFFQGTFHAGAANADLSSAQPFYEETKPVEVKERNAKKTLPSRPF